METQERDEAKELSLHEENTTPWGIWSNGIRMWVSDFAQQKIYFYNLADGSHLGHFVTDFTNTAPTGLWSDGTILWVSDIFNNEIFAYRLSGPQDNTKNFANLPYDRDVTNYFGGLWSDGTTLWRTNIGTGEILAYHFDGPMRGMADPTKNFSRDILVANNHYSVLGLWSDGTTMWVPDNGAIKIFAYNME